MSYQPVVEGRTPENEIAAVNPEVKKSFFGQLTEDWWAVLIGGTIITIVLLVALLANGFKFELPVYQWAASADLFNKVLSGHNLLLIVITGIVFLLLSAIAIVLFRK